MLLNRPDCQVFCCSLGFVCQVSVPKDLVAVMSAVGDGQDVDAQDNNRVVYRFRQPVGPPDLRCSVCWPPLMFDL